MKDKYRYLSKNIFLFSLSGFVPKLLAFFLIPLYTSYLTTAEYGISDLINTTVCLLIPIFTLDIQDAVMRFALDENYNKEDVFSIGAQIVIKGTIIVTIGAFVLSFLPIKGLTNEYLFFVVITYFITAANNVVSLFCRGIDQVKSITVGSILNSVIMLLSNIFFLTVLKWGLTGYLIANTLGSGVSLAYMFIRARLYRYVRLSVPAEVGYAMRAFSIPLIFSVLAWWVNNASDRYFLSWMKGVSVSGVYAVAYKIPTILTTFQGIFAQAWSISAVKEFDKNDSDGFIGNMYTLMNFAMVALCSFVMVINIPLAKILYSNDFFIAWEYVPPLLISVVCNAMALFIGSIFTAVKDTKTLAISTVAGAAANIACNFVLIPFWGAYGAAIATLIGYGVTLLIRHIILFKYIHMKIRWKRDLLCYVLLFLQMIIAVFGWKAIPIQCVFLILIILQYRKEAKKVVTLLYNKFPCRR
ncbi:polysaccharide biosynthesis C-terminal domain-containing protein [[Clostridium] cellulosi]